MLKIHRLAATVIMQKSTSDPRQAVPKWIDNELAIDREADARLDRANPYGRDIRLDLRKRGGGAATPKENPDNCCRGFQCCMIQITEK